MQRGYAPYTKRLVVTASGDASSTIASAIAPCSSLTQKAAFFCCSVLAFIATSLLFPFTSIAIPRTIVLGANHSTPPYVIAETQKGLEIEIIKAAMNSQGYDVTLVFASQYRMASLLKSGKLDAVTPVTTSSMPEDTYISDSHITYRNIAVSLTSHNHTIHTISDLNQHVILAFQNAKALLGDEYRNAVGSSPRYLETPDQQKQVHSFFVQQDSVIVLEERIFQHYMQQLPPDKLTAYTVHKPFPLTHYHVAFRDPELREIFNMGLKAIKKSGEYARITGNYPQQCEHNDRTHGPFPTGQKADSQPLQ
ncbi:substrate-binding periplasmic protein [Oleidesulfovibrio sp.]|uniref:substrate-binding periplasmic protein n=1 Tax=Oleidesulfovibrio sp. TaxID=2909707 RepID=UPI003A852981